MENLSLVLWRERELLDDLLYRLETEQLLLSEGRTRWLARAANEVESVRESIREAELLRAVESDEAAMRLGLPANASLRALADAAAEPWRTILHDHRDAVATVTDEVTAMAAVNRELISAACRPLHEETV